MDKQKQKTIKRAIIIILAIYLTITLIPAAIYGVTSGETEKTGNSNVPASEILPEDSVSEAPAESAAAEGASSPPAPAESSAPPQTESSEQSESSSEIPGFLDGGIAGAVNTENKNTGSDIFRILDTATNEVLTVSGEEFLAAAVVCEMPLSAPVEALKAQAVAAYTYYCRERKLGGLENADFTCNTDSWLVYVTKDDMRERWGEDFEDNYLKIKEITDEVYGQLLTYEGELICAAYFSISNGSTEASANVWGGELAYLTQVPSPGDVLSEGYMSTKSISGEQIQQSLQSALEYDFDFSAAEGEWFQNQVRSDSGYTKTIDVCGVTIKGTELRTALSLSSTCFDVTYENGYYTFTVRGYGHGVGMSQAGAIFMAQQGSGYADILSHYYPGTTLG